MTSRTLSHLRITRTPRLRTLLSISRLLTRIMNIPIPITILMSTLRRQSRFQTTTIQFTPITLSTINQSHITTTHRRTRRLIMRTKQKRYTLRHHIIHQQITRSNRRLNILITRRRFSRPMLPQLRTKHQTRRVTRTRMLKQHRHLRRHPLLRRLPLRLLSTNRSLRHLISTINNRPTSHYVRLIRSRPRPRLQSLILSSRRRLIIIQQVQTQPLHLRRRIRHRMTNMTLILTRINNSIHFRQALIINNHRRTTPTERK